MSDLANGTEIPVSAKATCSFAPCDQEVISKCKNCNQTFCLDHASDVDPAHYCNTCLKPVDAAVTTEPLKDEEGTTHAGKLIKPAGKAYRLSSKMVFEMTDAELQDFINNEKSVVNDIERIRDYHHITLGLAESEAYRRNVGVLARVGGVLRVGTSTQTFTKQRQAKEPSQKVAKGTKVDKTLTLAADLMTALKMTPAEMAALIAGTGKKK